MAGGQARYLALAVAIVMSGCSAGDSAAPRVRSVIATGRATDAAGQRVKGAPVAIQVLWPVRTVTRSGCTGQYLIGEWTIQTEDDGEFGLDLRLNPPSRQACIVAYGTLPGDSVWRDSASVLSNLKIVEEGVAPDTAHFDLTFLK